MQRAGQSGLVGSQLNSPTLGTMGPLLGLDNLTGDELLGQLEGFSLGGSPERSVGIGKTVDVGENRGGVRHGGWTD